MRVSGFTYLDFFVFKLGAKLSNCPLFCIVWGFVLDFKPNNWRYQFDWELLLRFKFTAVAEYAPWL